MLKLNFIFKVIIKQNISPGVKGKNIKNQEREKKMESCLKSNRKKENKKRQIQSASFIL